MQINFNNYTDTDTSIALIAFDHSSVNLCLVRLLVLHIGNTCMSIQKQQQRLTMKKIIKQNKIW